MPRQPVVRHNDWSALSPPSLGEWEPTLSVTVVVPTFNDPNNANATWGIACNMTGGSSGGPWLYGTSDPGTDGSKLLSSVNSYGYQGLTYMFGPRFNGETTTVFGDAVDGSWTNGVSVIRNVP